MTNKNSKDPQSKDSVLGQSSIWEVQEKCEDLFENMNDMVQVFTSEGALIEDRSIRGSLAWISFSIGRASFAAVTSGAYDCGAWTAGGAVIFGTTIWDPHRLQNTDPSDTWLPQREQ